MKTKSFPIITIILYSLTAQFAFFSCDTDSSGDWPAEIEQIKVDYIGNTTAYFTLDILGDITDITEAGFCWSTTNPPDIDDHFRGANPIPGLQSFTATGLEIGITYYLRGYYKFENKVFYSESVPFTTTSPLTDRDGNEYGVVKIGNQLWTDQNLKVLTYNNGDPIIDGTGRGNYASLAAPKFYFHYDDDEELSPTYGLLYTWYVVTDSRGLCPPQWRVPDVADWEKMITHLDVLSNDFNETEIGGQELSPIVGGMMRTPGTLEAQTSLWHSPNSGANNVTALNAIPAGFRDPSGKFEGLGYNSSFWSYSERNVNSALMFYTHYWNPSLLANTFPKSSGYAVRCMRDDN